MVNCGYCGSPLTTSPQSLCWIEKSAIEWYCGAHIKRCQVCAFSDDDELASLTPATAIYRVTYQLQGTIYYESLQLCCKHINTGKDWDLVRKFFRDRIQRTGSPPTAFWIHKIELIARAATPAEEQVYSIMTE